MRYLVLFCALLLVTDSHAGKWFKRKHSRSAGACAGGVCTTEMGQTPPVDSSHTLPPATPTVKVGDVIDVKSWGQRKEPDVGVTITQDAFGNWTDRRLYTDYQMSGEYLGKGKVRIDWINPHPVPLVPPKPPAIKIGDVIVVETWGQRNEPAVGALLVKGKTHWRTWTRDPDREMEGVYLGKGKVQVIWLKTVPATRP